MERLIEILKSVRGDIDFAKETSLVDDGILDSFDVVAIVSELTMEYDITLTVDDMTAENFNSAQAMFDMIERIQEED